MIAKGINMSHDKKISIRDVYDEIDFSKSEYPALKRRLDKNKPIYTTRIKEEKNEYTVGQFLKSPFGLLEVIDVDTYRSIDQHPFKSDLTSKQKKEIEGKSYDLVKLILVPDK